MLDTYENQDEAARAAADKFLRLVANKAFTAPIATHYYVQALDNGNAVLSLGAIGTITQADGSFLPVADVNGSFTISPEVLEALARVIITAHDAARAQEQQQAPISG